MTLILDLLKFAWGIISSLFGKDGWKSLSSSWTDVAKVVGVLALVIGVLYIWNPFDDADKKQARADAKAERIATEKCRADLAQVSVANQSLADAANRAAHDAEARERRKSEAGLAELRQQNEEMVQRLREFGQTTGGLSARTLKEMGR